MNRIFLLLLSACSLPIWFSCGEGTPTSKANPTAIDSDSIRSLPPDLRYGPLFVEVQMQRIFEDGKTFVDCTPRFSTAYILEQYEQARTGADFNLKAFVETHFDLPQKFATGYKSDITRSAREHIELLWPVLTREPDQQDAGSLVPLPHPYIVPGGRFGEIYYWDSYFTMLGLEESGRDDMIEHMIDNFAYLIDEIGFIPNGNRTYFLSRSQPPFFAAMVELLANIRGDEVFAKYLPQMEREYAFWMEGAGQLSAEQPAYQRVVRLDEGYVLNRYWDNRAVPRAEMHFDDVETERVSNRPPEKVFRDIRAACESGWDFSCRWFEDASNLSTIATTSIIPVDLNALLYHSERTMAHAWELQGNTNKAAEYTRAADARREAIHRWCWSEKEGFFVDYNFQYKKPTEILSMAGAFPLFFQVATPEQAARVAQRLESDFLKPGGFTSTLRMTGQQWDAPNGWAPLQWIGIQGLRHYGFEALASEAAQRWINLNLRVYRETGQMVEKYNVYNIELEAGGGEYPLQDGFGWTNGVLLKLMD
jgi:alpha,alpha-trehalase